MNWIWLIVTLLTGFAGGTYLGFGFALKRIDPGDEINIKKAKNKNGIFELTNYFNKKDRNHGKNIERKKR